MRILRLSGVLLAFGICASSALAGDAQGAGQAGGWGPFAVLPRSIPEYRPYFYNYPHAIPPDYVFRTARVFPPQDMNRSIFSGLFFGRQGEAESASGGPGSDLHLRVKQLGKDLLANTAETLVDEYVVAVSTFVSLDNLYATSSFGRYLGEQLLTSLQQAGLEVIEVRKTPGLLISPHHGEYALSRSMDEISLVQNAQAVVVGTYKVAGQEIFVNARLLRNDDNRILASASLVLPLDQVSAGLLANESVPASIRNSQIAVRQFPEPGQMAAPPLAPVKKPAKTVVKSTAKKGGS